ncbi:hypothetical protein [Paludisphaera borealis]|uniref:Protein kinase domain-containing protein n=1 Tax=Paludisphaera borealis TaxID=1387353 RepID=A0A1U7CZ66_9BACT|nr:hypothetical protein [Paludisphaera borealis]APW64188.1 hypothetical protein BSF38_05780 [Paludisphaera borealis]
MSTTQVEGRSPSRVKPRPRWLRALGDGSPPEQLEIGGGPHRLVEVFKHDSWAATALYAGPHGARRVVKLHRRASAFGVPLSWVGWLTARREHRLLRNLADLPGIPALAGPVLSGGIPQKNAVAREYLDGHPLGDREAVNDRFFPELRDLLHAMHRRRIVYVDLHKRENVLVGENGDPCLFDFQISMDWPRWLPLRPIFPIMSGSDDYHLLKHWARCRPDQCGVADDQMAAKRPWWIRAHRLIARPIREMRRRLLVRIGVRTGKGRVESEQFAEHALRAAAPSDRQAA